MVTYGEPLPTRQLGRNGPQVSTIGYGAMGLSISYEKPKGDRLKILDAVIENGCYFLDSSNVYGDNEDVIGEWLKANPGLREKIFLATKFGLVVSINSSGGFDITENGTPEYVRECVEQSLSRLGTDYIDLYYYHRIKRSIPIEVTMGELKKLKEEGKIKHIGLSECSAETIRRAHAVEPLAAVQLEYSPFATEIDEPERNILNTCRELGIAIVAYSPLGRGLFTGRYRSADDFEEGDFRRISPRFNKENFPKNLVLVDHVKGIAEKKGVTVGQLTLAWILSRGEDFIPIPGSTRFEGIKENLSAAKITLTEEEKDEINNYVKNCEVVGERYPPGMTENLFQNTIPLSEYKA